MEEFRVKKMGGEEFWVGHESRGRSSSLSSSSLPSMPSRDIHGKGFNILSSFCSQLVYSGLAVLICMQDEEKESERVCQ